MSYRVSSQRGVDRYADGNEHRGGSACVGRRGKLQDYTLAHAGRHLRLRPGTFWTVVSLLLLMALWSAGTATYFAFRDDILARLISGQAETQYVYEDRIAELRAQVDRLNSRKLLDQQQIQQRVEQLMRRQSVLEQRSSALSGLPDSAPASPVRAGARHSPRADGNPPSPPRPSPLNEPGVGGPALDRRSSLQPSAASAFFPHWTDAKHHGVPAVLTRIQESLDRIEARQSAALLALEDGYDAKARNMRGVLIDLGVDTKKVAAASAPSGIGGPFVPLPARSDSSAFERQLHRVQVARLRVDQLNHALVAVPVRKPLTGELDSSSGFGVRIDPFLRAPAMHSGLDLRAAPGEPVRATAGGTVISAGWNGGYGRMVEIDHGNGFTTRYGHLSAILVKEDQVIKPGQPVGRVGSTGRSTGPHLHYETRIDGDAVDPHRFLRAGLRLGDKLH